MKQITAMIKPASSLCNLNCKYCFYHDISSNRENESYGIMQRDIAEKVIDSLILATDKNGQINIGFQGGEPLLAGLDFYKYFINYVNNKKNNIKVNYSLQTNGILINEEWAKFFKDNYFLVGISIDGDSELHDNNRIDGSQKGTFKEVIKAKQILDTYKVEYNVLCVLTDNGARHSQKIWKFICNNNIRFIQFIPCLSELSSNIDKSTWSLTPKRFYSFYYSLFYMWKKQVDMGNYISVKLFDDIANLLIKGQLTACGIVGRCSLQNVIEADGGVYPCDFYALDQYRSGSFVTNSVEEVIQKMEATGFLESRGELPIICSTCKYLKVCGGGCKRMQSTIISEGSENYCGYQNFLDDCLDDLLSTAKKLIG